MENLFTFSEITRKEVLEKIFRFRYEMYSKYLMNSLIEPNDHRIDVDHNDAHSRHYALTSGNANAGYFRVVMPGKNLPRFLFLNLPGNIVFSTIMKSNCAVKWHLTLF